MKKIFTLLTVTTLSLVSCKSAQKKLEDVDKVTLRTTEKSIGMEKLYKAIFSVRYDRVAKLNRNTDKVFVRSEDSNLDLYKRIKEDLEASLRNQGFTLTSTPENNVEVIVENNHTNESYMPHFVNLTIKKYFKGDSVSVIRATMRANHEDLENDPSAFMDKFVKVILEGKALTNKLSEWIVE